MLGVCVRLCVCVCARVWVILFMVHKVGRLVR